MKKITRIMMIAAVAIAGLSLIGLLISLLFQRTFVDMLYGSVVEQPDFLVPVGTFLSCCGRFAVALVMLFVVCNERFHLKSDAICAGVLVVGIPLISNAFTYVQTWFTAEFMEVGTSIYLSNVSGVCSYSQRFLGVATALTLLACGMSIAVKYLNGKK